MTATDVSLRNGNVSN